MNPLWYERRRLKLEKRARSNAMRKSKQLAQGNRGMVLEENEVFAVVNSLGYKCKQQQQFIFTSKPNYRIVDLWLPDYHIAIEVDGKSHFTSIGRLADRERQKQFDEEYPHVRFIRVTYEQIKKEGFRDELHKKIFNLNIAK